MLVKIHYIVPTSLTYAQFYINVNFSTKYLAFKIEITPVITYNMCIYVCI